METKGMKISFIWSKLQNSKKSKTKTFSIVSFE